MQTNEDIYTQSRLENQLRIYTRTVPSSRVLHLGLFVRHGSQDEDLDTSGIAHFIEHVLFNPRYFSDSLAKVYERLVDHGATYDASTTKEYTRFMLRCLPESLNDALEFLSLLARGPRPSQEAVETERAIVLHEHAMAFSSIKPGDSQILDNTIWGNHSIGLFILGRKQNIERFTVDEIEERIRSYYVPERILLCLVGPVVAQDVEAAAARFLGDWPSTEGDQPVPRVEGKPFVTALPSNAQRIGLQLGYLGVPFGAKERPAMELLASVLGSWKRSPLFEELRQVRKLAYLVHAAPVIYEHGGYLAIYVDCERKDVKTCYTAIQSVLERLRSEGVDTETLERSRSERLVAALDAMEINRQYLQLLGRRLLLDQPFDARSEARTIRGVEGKEIADISEHIFGAGHPAAVGIGMQREELEQLFD